MFNKTLVICWAGCESISQKTLAVVFAVNFFMIKCNKTLVWMRPSTDGPGDYWQPAGPVVLWMWPDTRPGGGTFTLCGNVGVFAWRISAGNPQQITIPGMWVRFYKSHPLVSDLFFALKLTRGEDCKIFGRFSPQISLPVYRGELYVYMAEKCALCGFANNTYIALTRLYVMNCGTFYAVKNLRNDTIDIQYPM